VVVFFGNFSPKLLPALKTALAKLGGREATTKQLSTVTHVVTLDAKFAKAKELLRSAPQAVWVTPNWLAESTQRNTLLPVDGFHSEVPKKAPAIMPPPPEPASQMPAEMQPNVGDGDTVMTLGDAWPHKRDAFVLSRAPGAHGSIEQWSDDDSDGSDDDDDDGGHDLQEREDKSKRLQRRLACQPKDMDVAPDANGDRPLSLMANAALLKILKRLAMLYSALSDVKNQYRSNAFHHFKSLLKDKVHFEIVTFADAHRALKLVGRIGKKGQKGKSSCAELLYKYVQHGGTCNRLEALISDPNLRAAEELVDVWGIATSTAKTLIARGITSIAQLRAQVAQDDLAGTPNATLNDGQRLGLKYHEDLMERIPRREVEAIRDVVIQDLRAHKYGRQVIAYATGSYRRGSPDSGDVDMLITHRNYEAVSEMLENLLVSLYARGFMKHTLSGGTKSKDHDVFTFMGICRLSDEDAKAAGLPTPTRYRRIDIKIYPFEMWPFALMYFTGNTHFNRSMRYYANRRGWSLSDHGLVMACGTGVGGDRHKAKVLEDKVRRITTEEEVFKVMGLQYVPPERRNA